MRGYGFGRWRELDRRSRELRREARRLRRAERRMERGGIYMDPRDDVSKKLYRSRSGLIFGVCRGLADYLDFSVAGMRLLTIFAALFTGIWPLVGAYVIAALLIKPEPVVPFSQEGDQEFYESYMNSRTMALQRLKRTYDNLERRIRRMENMVTARDYDWERRFNEP